MKQINIYIKVYLLIGVYMLLSYSSKGQSVGETSESEIPALVTDLNEEVNIGFILEKKSDIVGAISTIDPTERMKYDNTQWVRDAISGLVTGVRGSDNIRGLGTALIVVDGIPGRDVDMLNMDEIQEIIVLKDAQASALYGAMGKNGVILITTKRGKSDKKFNISASFGYKTPQAMPEYLNSADYMVLYNEAYNNDGNSGNYYTESEIENFRSGVNPYQYPDVDFYNNDYMKQFTPFSNVFGDFSGGMDDTKFYISVGFKSDGDLQKVNPDIEKAAYRFNVRGNIDFKVNDWIKSTLDVVSIIDQKKSSKANLYNEGQTFRPNMYAPLLPISLIDTVGNESLEGSVKAANKFDGYLLGGSSSFKDVTPIASILAGGNKTYLNRISQVNNSIDFDLDKVTEGLSAKTYVSFDFYNAYELSVDHKYAMYEPTWNTNNQIIGLVNVNDSDTKDLKEHVSTNGFVIRYGFYGLINYEKTFADIHDFNTSVVGFVNNTYQKDEKQSDKNIHVAYNANYSFDGKLFADFSAAYIHSVKLAEGNRGQFAPSLGLGYLVKDVDTNSWLNYLKVKASAGLLYTDDNFEYYLYDATFTQDGDSYYWGDESGTAKSNKYTTIGRGANPDLEMENRIDYNLGFEANVLSSIWVEANAFQSTFNNKVTQASVLYPSYYNDFRPYINYGEDRYRGFEIGVNYDENFGDFGIDMGIRALYSTSERMKVDEKFNNDYQYRQGTKVDSYWGLEDLGFFTASDFDSDGNLVDGVPTQFGTVQAGDIKYKDQNGDGVVDDNDEVVIGQWNAPWVFNSDMTFSYKGFSLFVLFSAEVGADGMKSQYKWDSDANEMVYADTYYRVQGTNKYSEVVLDRWTPETAATAKYPRLTASGSANNFQKNSTFWLYSKSQLNIQRAQLTYALPVSLVDQWKMDDVRFYVAGSNLLQIAPNKEINELSIGTDKYSPNYRYFSLGLRLKF